MIMFQTVIFSLAALASLVPASVVPFRRDPQPDTPFWAATALAVAGPLFWALDQVADTWRTGLSTTLWVSIATCMVLFAGLAAATRTGWRLAPLLLPYLLLIAVLATATLRAPDPVLEAAAPETWVALHIVVSVTGYALLTVGAVAALAAFLQEQALKTKRPTALTRLLPPIADSEALQLRLLTAAAAVTGIGVLTGMAVLYYEHGVLLRLDHKILFSLASFAVISGLLIAHAMTGVRGRRAARLALLAYLLLTLGYPGVKFVTDVLLS
jgi:ABC-type uncharacterized transport system permease subunit